MTYDNSGLDLSTLCAIYTKRGFLGVKFVEVKIDPKNEQSFKDTDDYTFYNMTTSDYRGIMFDTAIYAIIPDCVEYGEWRTGLRNDGFQYAFVSLGNKIGMAVGTALLAALLGKYGYVANQTQNPQVLAIMQHAFSTIPGVLWIVTAVVLFFYRLNKKRYNEIVAELKNGKNSV